MTKVIKTTFEEEQKYKDEAFLKMTPLERMDRARKVRERMKKLSIDYAIEGLVVKVSKLK